MSQQAGLRVTRTREVEDYILVLDEHEDALGYQRTYGDAIAEAYEDLKVIVLPSLAIDADLDFLNAIAFPPQFKKISAGDGIGDSLFERNGKQILRKSDHPVNLIAEDLRPAAMINHQIASVFAQLRVIVRQLFPAYRTLREGTLTWRFTPTGPEVTHFDGYAPESRFYTREHRIKFFLNLDHDPRVWGLTHRIDKILRDHRAIFPDRLPDHLNEVARIATEWPGLQDMPHHELHYPQLSLVLGNAEAIGHQVRYGNRMVAGEFFIEPEDMLDPSKSVHNRYDPTLPYGFA